MLDLYIETIAEEDGRVTFQFPRAGNGQVTGIERIAQKFIKILLTTPGSDKFFPNLGGGIDSILRKTFSGSTYEDDVESAALSSVSAAKSQMKRIQAGQSLPRKEVFIDAQIIFINIDKSSLSAEIGIRIVTAEGSSEVVISSGGVTQP